MGATHAEVTVWGRENTCQRFLLEPGDYLIGSDPKACQIHIDEREAAPQHAKLKVDRDSLCIEDLGSSSGTYVGGQPVQGSVRFKPDQKVRIGTSLFEFQFVDTSEATVLSDAGSAAPARRRDGHIPTFQPRNYEIGQMVARGGMGGIYQVKDNNIGRSVALKRVLSDREISDEHVHRFIQEAQVNGQLEHPNIVPVYELGSDDEGMPFYTMKFVKGVTLHDVLSRIKKGDPETIERYPIPHLLTIFQKVCDAMAFSHSKGVVHRDLKPANIMIGSYGEVLVMDWGLAKVLSKAEKKPGPGRPAAGQESKIRPVDASQTMDGRILGTLNYMAPEQAEGRVDKIDARTDIYALGGILYTLLTLEPPIRGKSMDEMLSAITMGEIPPPLSYNEAAQKARQKKLSRPAKGGGDDNGEEAVELRHLPGGMVPQSLSAVAMKALSVKPQDRYQTVKDLQKEIEAFQGGFATAAEEASLFKQLVLLIKRHKREAVLLASGFLVVVALVTVFMFALTKETRRAVKGEQKALAAQKETLVERDRAIENERQAREARAKEEEARQLAEKKRLESEEQKKLAQESEQKALQARQNESLARTEAERRGEEARQRLIRLHVASGISLVNTGDWLGALPWYAEALRLDEGTPAREETDRLRLGVLLRSSPKPTQFWFHEKPVKCVKLSPDGQRAASASEDGTARIWNILDGQPSAPPMRHQDKVLRLAFSPDGKRLVTASADKTAQVWNAANGRPVCPPLKHKAAVLMANFSPDGAEVVTASLDGTAQMWNAETGEPKGAPLPHKKGVHSARYSPDGKWVVTAGEDGAARIWDRATAEPLQSLERHINVVENAAFSPDSKKVVTCSHDGTAILWDAATGQVLATLRHGDLVWDAAFSPDGQRLITASYDRTARVWDAATGQPVFVPFEHGGAVWHASFSGDGKTILTAAHDGTARVWDAATGRPTGPPLKHSHPLVDAAMSADGRRVLTAGENHAAALWDLATARPWMSRLKLDHPATWAQIKSGGKYFVTASEDGSVQIWESATCQQVGGAFKHNSPVLFVTFSPDGRALATGCKDGTARIWDVARSTVVGAPLRHEGAVTHLAFSADGRQLATASEDKAARVWDAATAKPITPPLKHEGGVFRAAFRPDGRQLATAGADKCARLWNLPEGGAAGDPLRHQSIVYSVEYSWDGRRIVTASQDGTAQVWEAASGKPASPPLKHGDLVYQAVFRPDGQAVATACNDTTARIWDPKTGELLVPPLRHRGAVHGIQFSRNGRYLLSTSRDGTAMVWDAATGEALVPPLAHNGSVECAQFSPESREIITAGGDGSVAIWDFTPDARPSEDLSALAGVLSGSRILPSVGLAPLDPDSFAKAWRALHSKYPSFFLNPAVTDDRWKASRQTH